MRLLRNLSYFTLAFFITIMLGINFAHASVQKTTQYYIYGNQADGNFASTALACQHATTYPQSSWFGGTMGTPTYELITTNNGSFISPDETLCRLHVPVTSTSGTDDTVFNYHLLPTLACPSGTTENPQGTCDSPNNCTHSSGDDAGTMFVPANGSSIQCDGTCEIVPKLPLTFNQCYVDGRPYNCSSLSGNTVIQGLTTPAQYNGNTCNGANQPIFPTVSNPTTQDNCKLAGGYWGTANGISACIMPVGSNGSGSSTSTTSNTTTSTSTTYSSGGNTTTTTTVSSGTPSIPNIDISSLNKEGTQQAIKSDLDSIKDDVKCTDCVVDPNQYNAQAQNSQTKTDDFLTTVSNIPTETDNFKAMFLDASWIPDFHREACTPLTGTIHGHTFTLDYCDGVSKLNELIGWLYALFGAWYLVSLVSYKVD